MLDSPFKNAGKISMKESGVYDNPSIPVAHNNGSKLPVKFFEDMPVTSPDGYDSPMKTVMAKSPGTNPASGSGAPWKSKQTESPFTKGKQ